MAPLPGLNKGVTKDPSPPPFDTQISPIIILDGTTLVTTKTTNETIDNVDEIIDYISGDAASKIPQLAIEDLVTDLAGKEDSLGFTPEDSANKGAISGYAGLDSSQELLLANFPAGSALQVLRRNAANDGLEFAGTGAEIFTWTADHSMDTFKLTAAAGNDVIINAPTGQGVSIEINGTEMYLFNSIQADFQNNNIINVSLITPTIASFINASHAHQDFAGGGLLDSTLALSDTANITYLNTANIWSSGLQNFSAVTLRIPVNSIPSVTVNGDIAFDDSVADFVGGLIKFFGIEEQAIVSMPISQFTTPADGFVVTYNATNDQFELQSGGAGTGDVVGPGSSVDNAITRFDGVTGKLIQNGVVTIDDVANMQNIRSLQFTTFSSAPVGTTHIALVDDDFHINTTTGNSIMMMVNDVEQYDFTSTSANFHDNELLLGAAFIQFTSISSPGVTGADTVGRLFLDNGNLNHISIIRNGAIIDLEVTEIFTWTADHDANSNALRNFSFIESDNAGVATTGEIRLAPDESINWGTNNSIAVNTTPHMNFVVGGATIISLRSAGIEMSGKAITGLGGTSTITSGALRLDDNVNLIFGTGTDATINYDGTDLIIQSAVVGTGVVRLLQTNATQVLELEANHTTPAAAQVVGQLDFIDDSSTGVRRTYGQIRTVILDPNNGSEDGEVFFSAINNGVATDVFSINAGSNGDLKMFKDLNMDSNNLTGLASLISSNPGVNMIMSTSGWDFFAEFGDTYEYRIDGIIQLILSADVLDVRGNDIDRIQNLINDLSTSGTDVDFTEDMLQEISISANTTFTGTGYAIGKSKILKITTDGTLRTLDFPAGWVFLGTKPVDQVASKTGILSLTSFTGAEAGVIAVYAVEQ